MPVPTGRVEGQIVTAADINNIAAVLNALELATENALALARAAETPDGAQAKADRALLVGAVRTAGGSVVLTSGSTVVPITSRGARTTRAVINRALTGNVATLTTNSPHDFLLGRTVTVAGIDATFNGSYRISGITSPTSFTYDRAANNVPGTATASGTSSSYTQTAPLSEMTDSEGNTMSSTSALGAQRFAAGVRAGADMSPSSGVDLLLDSLLS